MILFNIHMQPKNVKLFNIYDITRKISNFVKIRTEKHPDTFIYFA